MILWWWLHTAYWPHLSNPAHLALYFPTHTGRPKYRCSASIWSPYSHLHCLGASVSQTELGGNPAATVVSNDQAQSKPLTVIQVQSSPKDFPSNMKKHALTKIHRSHTPIWLSICTPAFSGWRKSHGYLIHCTCKRAAWSIYKVQGS